MKRSKPFRWAIAAGLLTALAAPSAVAQQQVPCGKREDLAKHLNEKFHEQKLVNGVVGNFAVMEIFVSSAGKWTVLMTDTNGRSCIVAAGEGWDAPSIVLAEGA